MALPREELLTALSESPLFMVLGKETLEQIVPYVKLRQYFPQDTIVWQGQPSTALFLIVNGIVAVKHRRRDQEHVLAYLTSGNSFGEVGILENQPRSATVQALSEVDVLVIQREDFLKILHEHPSVAISLARILGHYLVQTSRKRSSEGDHSRVMLIIPTQKHMGAGTLAALMAAELVNIRHSPTALLDYPDARRILSGYQMEHGRVAFRHPEGFDLLLPQTDRHLPSSTRTTILVDQLMETYDNLVIVVRSELDEGAYTMLDHADQIILLAPPTQEGRRDADRIRRKLKGRIRPEETNVMLLVNRARAEWKDAPEVDEADLELPYLPDFPEFQLPAAELRDLPAPIEQIVQTCVERLERNQSLGIFIPTTVDANQTSDTSVQLDRTMAFMAERFGGATCKIVNGVWLSERLGLVGEVIYVVYSYITHQDMNRHLDEVVDYLKDMKRELRQEAMALEINRKLTLV